MSWFTYCARLTVLTTGLLLGACASTVSVSDLSEPNFGYRVLPHFDASFDPDPLALANGLYASPSLQDPCVGYFRCSSQSRFQWSAWSP